MGRQAQGTRKDALNSTVAGGLGSAAAVAASGALGPEMGVALGALVTAAAKTLGKVARDEAAVGGGVLWRFLGALF